MDSNIFINNRKEKIMLYGSMAFLLVIIYFRSTSFRISEGSLIAYINSYHDGFRSGGLIGTVWQGICKAFSLEYTSYDYIYTFSKGMLVLYYILLLIVLITAISRSNENNKKSTIIMAFATILFAGSMFANGSTLGRYDMYMAMVLLVSMILLLLDKGRYFIVILSAIGVLIHPSYLIKCLPIVVLLLVHRGLKRDKIIAICSTIVSVALYVLSEISAFMYSSDEATSSLLPEWSSYYKCYINLAVYIILMMPYTVIGIKLFRRIRKQAAERRLQYKLLQWGVVLIAIEFILKIDYGIYVYYVMMYYFLLMLYMLSTDDRYYTDSINSMIASIKNKIPVSVVLLIYPVLFIPITKTNISSVCSFITELFIK